MSRSFEDNINPYDAAHAQQQAARKLATQEAERLFPTPRNVNPYDLNDVAEVNRVHRSRERYIDDTLRRHRPER